MVDQHLLQQALAIAASLEERDCKVALEFCAQNRSKLKKNKSRLEFRLRVQEFVELTRQGQTMQAVAYAKRHLTPSAKDNMPEFKKAVTAIVFGPSTPVKRYR